MNTLHDLKTRLQDTAHSLASRPPRLRGAQGLAAAGVLLMMLAPVTAPVLHADPTNGATYDADTIPHGDDMVYHINYNGGEEGDVLAAAADDSDDQYLEIKVYDPDGNLVTRDFGADGHIPSVSFDVDGQWSSREYTIKVVNLSYHDISYAVHFF